MIEVKELSKSFNGVEVLHSVSLRVEPGEIVGFVGMNGSGKTTTMRSIMALISYESGEVFIDGDRQDAGRTFAEKLGYMPEERGLYANQPVQAQLEYFGQLQGLTSSDSKRRAVDLLDTFGLTKKARHKLSDLSLGNQQRVQLMVSMIHEPKYLILDEPFSGLDPVGVQDLLNLILGQRERGVGILFSSHILPYVEQLCDKVVIIHQGRIVSEKKMSELSRDESRKYEITCERSFPNEWLMGIDAIEIKRTNDVITVELSELTSGSTSQLVLQRAMEFGEIKGFNQLHQSLDAYYKKLINADVA